MSVKQRDLSWDFVKSILMFLVVFGHFCPAGESWTPVTRIIGLFAIPGFFFISGFFQSQVNDLSGFWEKMRRLFMRIILPMLSWGTVYVLLSLLQYVFMEGITDANEFILFAKYFPNYIMGIYWFLTALILCVIVGSSLSLLIERFKFIGMTLLFVSPILFCLLSLPFFEHYHFSFVWLFYVVGMSYKHVADRFSSNNFVWDILFLVFFAMIVVVGAGYEPQNTFYYKNNLIRESSIIFVIGRFVLYLAATSSVIYGILNYYLIYKEFKMVKRVASYGSDTLFIYCSHVLILVFLYRPFLLPYLYHEDGGWIARIFEHVVGIIVSFLMYFLMQKLCLYCKHLRWMRVFFMGTK